MARTRRESNQTNEKEKWLIILFVLNGGAPFPYKFARPRA